MQPKIRLYQDEDIESLTELTQELGYPSSLEQMKSRMQQINSLDSYWTYVALVDDEVVGYIGISKTYHWEQDDCSLRIQAFAVKKEYRKNGLGALLLKTAETHAKSIGAHLILLNCGDRPERADAHRFYIHHGFSPKSVGYRKMLD